MFCSSGCSVMLWSACIVGIFLYFWLWNRRKRNPNELPELPGALPLIGHLHLLSGDGKKLWEFVKYISYESLKAGGVIAMQFGTRTVYAVTDPKDCLTLSKTCIQKDNFYTFGKPWVGEGLVTATPAIWKVHRKLLNPLFNQQVLDGFLNLFNSQSRKFVNDLRYKVDQEPFYLSNYTHRIILETITCTTLGINDIDKDCIDKEYLYLFKEMFKTMTIRFQNFLLHFNFIFNMTHWRKREKASIKSLHRLSTTILESKKTNYLKNRHAKENDTETKTEVQFKSFLDLFLELSIEKGALNDHELREEIDTLIGAGQDTLATSIAYTILLIGSYPKVQEILFEELIRVFDGEDRDVTKKDLTQLVYLEAVIKESMRFYTVVPVFARSIKEDVKLSHCTLPAGTTCLLLTYGMHRHESWGLDVEEFKPERWLDPTLLSKSAGAFAAFSLGRRACIGISYSMLLMKIMLAHLLRSYKFKGDHTKMVLKGNLILEPDTGHVIQIESR